MACGTGTRHRGREPPAGALRGSWQAGAAGEIENGPSTTVTTTGTSLSAAAPVSTTSPHGQLSCRSPHAGRMPTTVRPGESLPKAGASSPRTSAGSGIKHSWIKGLQGKPAPAQLIRSPPLLLLYKHLQPFANSLTHPSRVINPLHVECRLKGIASRRPSFRLGARQSLFITVTADNGAKHNELAISPISLYFNKSLK